MIQNFFVNVCSSDNCVNITNIPYFVFYIVDSTWGLDKEGLKGLQSIIQHKLWDMNKMAVRWRETYLQILAGAETFSLSESSEDDGDDDDSCFYPLSDEEL